MSSINKPCLLRMQLSQGYDIVCSYDLTDDASCSNTKMIKVNSLDVKYEDFFHDYLVKNRPCICSREITQDWRAVKDWRGAGDTINYDILGELYGKLVCIQFLCIIV